MSSSSSLRRGAHIVAHRRFYTHHGVFIGRGRVIHFAPDDGVATFSPEGIASARIREDSLAMFTDGDVVTVDTEPAAFSVAAVIARARSRLGEGGYHPVRWNCEHFARWCREGEATCRQMDTVIALTDTVLDSVLTGPRGEVLKQATRITLREEDRSRIQRRDAGPLTLLRALLSSS